MLSDPKKTKDEIIQWIRDYFAENGTNCSAVVGISGGKDSSIVAALCAEALGANRVFGVMMPDGEQPDIEDSKRLITALGIRYGYINIHGVVQALLDQVGFNMDVSEQTKVNLPARVRMATLYAVASISSEWRTCCEYMQSF